MGRRSEIKSDVLHILLTPTAKRLVVAMAEDAGISQGALIEQMVRIEAKRRGVTTPPTKLEDTYRGLQAAEEGEPE